MPEPTHYEILGVEPDATPAQIRRAYQKLASRHHPDKEGVDGEFMKKVNAAEETLSDPDKRKLYDAGMGDDSPESLRLQALDLIESMFGQYIDSELEGGFLRNMHERLAIESSNFAHGIGVAEVKRRKLRKLIGRISRKSGEDNLFEKVLVKRLGDVIDHISEQTKQREVNRLARELLEDFVEIEPASAFDEATRLLGHGPDAALGRRFFLGGRR